MFVRSLSGIAHRREWRPQWTARTVQILGALRYREHLFCARRGGLIDTWGCCASQRLARFWASI